MAYPYTMFENFASAGKGVFDTETDTASILDYPHYTELARHKLAPYRGSYCMRITAAGGTTTAHLRESTSLDIALSGTLYIRWYFCLGYDFVMADSDKFSMLELESTLDTTTEVAVGIRRNGSNLELWWNETTAAAAPSTFVLGTTATALGRWRCVEVKTALSSGGADGTIDVWVDDGVAGSQIGSLTQAAIAEGKFGLIGPDAGTSGTILFADFIADDAQIYADGNRFRPLNQWLIGASNQPLVGPGRFSIGVTGTGTDAVCTVYDQDGVQTRLEPVVLLRNVTANEFVPGHDIFQVNHGAYVTLTGTNPQAFISIEQGGLMSQAAYINRGLKNGRPYPYATG